MGNYAHLLTESSAAVSNSKKITNKNDSPYLLQRDYVPFFWLALFQANDLAPRKRTEDIEESDFDTECVFVIDKSIALANFNQHRPLLIQRFGDRVDELANQFIDYMMSGNEDSIVLDADELRGDFAPADYVKDLLDDHRRLTHPKLALVPCSFAKPDNTYFFVGAGSSDETPWEKEINAKGFDPLEVKQSKPERIKVEPEKSQQPIENIKPVSHDGFSISGLFKKWFGK